MYVLKTRSAAATPVQLLSMRKKWVHTWGESQEASSFTLCRERGRMLKLALPLIDAHGLNNAPNHSPRVSSTFTSFLDSFRYSLNLHFLSETILKISLHKISPINKKFYLALFHPLVCLFSQSIKQVFNSIIFCSLTHGTSSTSNYDTKLVY